jgi:KH domain
MKLELSMHTLVCGRTRKNIKLIEAATNTAIYFPPPFPRIFGYTPPGASRRSEDEVYITGESQEQIATAKQKLRELVLGVKIYVKDVVLSASKIDNILLDRLDKVRKVMEANGSYVLFPQLGSQRGLVRIQGTEVLHVERTVREIMALVRYFDVSFFARLLISGPFGRLVSSTVHRGGSLCQTLLKAVYELRLQRMSGQCSLTSAQIPVPM